MHVFEHVEGLTHQETEQQICSTARIKWRPTSVAPKHLIRPTKIYERMCITMAPFGMRTINEPTASSEGCRSAVNCRSLLLDTATIALRYFDRRRE